VFNDGVDVARWIERHKPAVVVAAAVAPLVVCAVLAQFRDGVAAATDVLVLVLVVVAAASTGVRIAGIVAAVSGAVWFDYFLTQPYEQLTIKDQNDVEAAVLLVLIGALVTEVALWGHRNAARASRRAGYLDGVLGTAEIVTLRDETADELIRHICEQIQAILDVDGCRFVTGPITDPRVPILDHRGLVTREGRAVDVERSGLPSNDVIAVLVTRGDVTLGHFLITAATSVARPTLEQRKVAVLLAVQAGAVIADQKR
jgi:hypothetical protein